MTKPRPYNAGYNLANSLCEVGNILYLLDNREQFLQGIKVRIDQELVRMLEVEMARKI